MLYHVTCVVIFFAIGETLKIEDPFAEPGSESIRIKIARCRATCLEEFNNHQEITSDIICNRGDACLMCWETCEMLILKHVMWNKLCDEPAVCNLGCQVACKFHTLGSIDAEHKAHHWSFLAPFHYKKVNNSFVVSWSAAESAENRLSTRQVVYSVMRRSHSLGDWTELKQTSELSIAMPSWMLSRPSKIKIVAVSSFGVLTEEVLDGDDSRPADLLSSLTTWKPQLISLESRTGKSHVEAIVTWPSSEPPGRYDVTWSVIDDMLEIRGHLYTYRTIATLTLFPTYLYSIEIRSINSIGKEVELSSPLLIDTRNFGFGNTGNILSPNKDGQCNTLMDKELVILGLTCAIVVFAMLSILLWLCARLIRTTRRRRSTTHFTKVNSAALSKGISPSSPKAAAAKFVYDNLASPAMVMAQPRKLIKKLSRRLSNLSLDQGGPQHSESREELLTHEDTFETEKFVYPPQMGNQQ